MAAENGAAVYGDMLLVTSRQGYYFLTPDETRPPGELPRFGEPGADFSGKPCLFGDRLVISNRFTGRLSVVDVADIERPRLLKTYELEGNPGRVELYRGRIVIPAGYQGLLVTAENVA